MAELQPWEEMAGCLAGRLRKLARRVTSLYEEAMRAHNLTAAQSSVLAASAHMDPARPAIICRMLAMDASTLSRNLDRLEARGLVETVPGEDGRERPYQVTEAGKQILVAVLPAWRQAQMKARNEMGDVLADAVFAATEWRE